MTLLATNMNVSREPVFGISAVKVDDVISPNNASRVVFVLLVGFDFADDLGVVDFFTVVGGYIPVPCWCL